MRVWSVRIPPTTGPPCSRSTVLTDEWPDQLAEALSELLALDQGPRLTRLPSRERGSLG
jgi:hypothetical protein